MQKKYTHNREVQSFERSNDYTLSNMNISVVIVHWNTPDILRKQLFVLENGKEIQIIVIDNNSKKYPRWIKKEFQQVRYLQNNDNLGFAKACNQGAKIAKGEWLAFFNPDIEITSSALKAAVEIAEEKKYDAFSPEPESSDYKKPLPSWQSLLVEFSPLRRIIPFSVFKTHTLTGGSLFIRRKVFEKIKGWDERFFLWFEDSDLTKRLIDGDYRVGFVESPGIKHIGAQSFKQIHEQQKKKIFFNSMNIYADIHFSTVGKIIVKLITFLNV